VEASQQKVEFDLVVKNLKELAAYAAEQGEDYFHRAAESFRD